MKFIEKSEDLKLFLDENKSNIHDNCVIAVCDNKSDVTIQFVVIENPISFIRGIQEFCNSIKIPVADLDIVLIGLIDSDFHFTETEHCYISPYVYFKKPDDSKDSDGK